MHIVNVNLSHPYFISEEHNVFCGSIVRSFRNSTEYCGLQLPICVHMFLPCPCLLTDMDTFIDIPYRQNCFLIRHDFI
jgi:hypothetical protein